MEQSLGRCWKVNLQQDINRSNQLHDTASKQSYLGHLYKEYLLRTSIAKISTTGLVKKEKKKNISSLIEQESTVGRR